MNKFIIFIIAIIACSFTPEQQLPITVTLYEQKNLDLELRPEKRPRTQENTIIATYFEEHLTIQQNNYEITQVDINKPDGATIISIDTNHYDINSGIYIGNLNEFSITCTLSDGQTFYGEYNNL